MRGEDGTKREGRRCEIRKRQNSSLLKKRKNVRKQIYVNRKCNANV